MSYATVEHRILTALLLGSATSAELAKMLTEDMMSVHVAVQPLLRNKLVTFQEPPTGKRLQKLYYLTPAGRVWTEELIKCPKEMTFTSAS